MSKTVHSLYGLIIKSFRLNVLFEVYLIIFLWHKLWYSKTQDGKIWWRRKSVVTKSISAIFATCPFSPAYPTLRFIPPILSSTWLGEKRPTFIYIFHLNSFLSPYNLFLKAFIPGTLILHHLKNHSFFPKPRKCPLPNYSLNRKNRRKTKNKNTSWKSILFCCFVF